MIILVVIILGTVVFLTLQGPEDTTNLSENVREWIGYKESGKAFRSDVHLIEYFVVGLALLGLMRAFGLKLWIGVLVACAFGLFDEGIKILLPTREFGAVDLIKDFFGVFSALGIWSLRDALNRKK